MSPFFNNIRRELSRESKVKSYLLYAIGEILLVVIGILIALQVNNWNQARLAHADAMDIKHNLNEEFTQNQATLDMNMRALKQTIQSSLAVINLIGASRSELEKYNLDSLLFFAFEGRNYVPSDNALQDILQSGRMKLLKDKELKDNLFIWSTKMKLLGETNKVETQWSLNNMLSHLLPYMSFREMDRYGDNPGKGISKIQTDYYPLFQQIEFENLLDNDIYYLQQKVDQLKEIKEIQQKIIDHTSPR